MSVHSIVMIGLAVAELLAAPVIIESGRFTPLYGGKPDGSAIQVTRFAIDRYPVTNREFMSFLEAHPEWQPARISPLYADAHYLHHFSDSLKMNESAPVVNVSWFAARAFCREQGGRLPTVLEWEYVGAADEKNLDASRDPTFVQKLLAWYSAPARPLDAVGKNTPNIHGIYDLHGLVWEWTEDFNSVFVSGDNRRDADATKNLFCAGGAVSANDRANYAAFMRYALRNSVRGNFTLNNLGFRCAYSME